MEQTNEQIALANEFVCNTQKNIFLTGRAGTGKTTFLKNLKEHLPKRMLITAPTGVAAINAGGVTMHSLFQLPFGLILPGYQKANLNKTYTFSKPKIDLLKSADLLVIDEISMVRADVLDAVDMVLRRYKNGHKAFGGIQLLMIGDVKQLAPIVKDEEWNFLKSHYETPYFFSSKALQEAGFITVQLHQIFRQQDETFIRILNQIRDNKLDAESLKILNNRYIPHFANQENEGYIVLTTHNRQAQEINNNRLQKLPKEAHCFEAEIEGDFPESAFPTERNLILKEDAQVMFIKNDKEKRFFNGKIGKITNISDSAITIVCDENEDPVILNRESWKNIKYEINPQTKAIEEKELGSFLQFPLKTAWAITVHKSQGLTFDKAIIEISSSFASGQVYVALSRCKSLEGVVLNSPITPSILINDEVVNNFIRKISNKEPTQTQLKQAKDEYQLEVLKDIFDFRECRQLLDQAFTLIKKHENDFPAHTQNAFMETQNMFKQSIDKVSEKFLLQIKHISQIHSEETENKGLTDRLEKAANYFLPEIENNSFNKLEEIGQLIIHSGAKIVWTSIYIELKAVMEVKHIYMQELLKGFNLKRLLDIRAKFLLKKENFNKFGHKEQHVELYAELAAWRDAMMIIKHCKSPFMVLSKKTMYDLIEKMPSTYAELAKIDGLGARKFNEFGSEILDIIRNYQEENAWKIPPLDEFKPQLVEEKKSNKEVSFDMFRQGYSINEIAERSGLKPGTIETHLAYFVERGQLNVDQLVEEEVLQKIQTAFERFPDVSLMVIKNMLGDSISWTDLKFAKASSKYSKNNN